MQLTGNETILLMAVAAAFGLFLLMCIKWREDTTELRKEIERRDEAVELAFRKAELAIDSVEKGLAGVVATPIDEMNLSSKRHSIVCVVDNRIEHDLICYVDQVKHSKDADPRLLDILQMFLFLPLEMNQECDNEPSEITINVWNDQNGQHCEVEFFKGMVFHLDRSSIVEYLRFTFHYEMEHESDGTFTMDDLSNMADAIEPHRKNIAWLEFMPADLHIFRSMEEIETFFESLRWNPKHLYRVYSTNSVLTADVHYNAHRNGPPTFMFDPEWLAAKNAEAEETA